jgi:hypothetical protein
VGVESLSVAVGGYQGGMRSSSVVFVHAFQCFQHDNRVAADDLKLISKVYGAMRCRWCGRTYDLADSDLLAAGLLLDGIIQDDVQKDLR